MMMIVEFLTPRATLRSGNTSLNNELDIYFSTVAMRTNGKICATRGRGNEFIDWAIEGFDSPDDPEMVKVLEELSKILAKYNLPLTTETYEVAATFS